MKFASIFALIATQAAAKTTLSVSVDEAEAARVAQAVAGRVMQWGDSNQEDLTTAAMSIKAAVEDALEISLAADVVRSQKILSILDFERQMVMADPEACDEEAFATCLVDSDSYDFFIPPENIL